MELRRPPGSASWLLVAAVALVVKQLVAFAMLDLAQTPIGLICTVASSLVVISPVVLLEGRRGWLIYGLVDFVVTLIIIADVAYFEFNRDLTSMAMIGVLRAASGVAHVAEPLIRPSQVLLLADVPIALLAFSLGVTRPARLRTRTGLALVALGVAVLVAEVQLDPYWARSRWRNPVSASKLGLVGFHLVNSTSSRWQALTSHDASDAEIAAMADWIRDHRGPTSTVQPTRWNVIDVQLESFQDFLIDLRIDGREVTPHLNALAHQGVRYLNGYSQISQGGTSDAEFLALCSMLPADRGGVFTEFATNSFDCLPEIVRGHGYSTLSIHGNNLSIYRRKDVYPRLGFDQSLGSTDLVMDHVLGLGLADESLYRQLEARLPSLPRPFLVHAVTLSSHRPFSGSPALFSQGKLAGTTLGLYLDSVHDADAALGQFLQFLDDSGLSRETVLVVYGDHAGVNRHDSGVLAFTGWDRHDEATWFHFERAVPLIFRWPGGPQGQASKAISGQIDIAPTILGRLGLPVSAPFFGRDLVANPVSLALFPRGSAADDEHTLVVHDVPTPWCVRTGTDQRLPLTDCDDLQPRVKLQTALNQRILDHDLVPRLRRHFDTSATPTARAPSTH